MAHVLRVLCTLFGYLGAIFTRHRLPHDRPPMIGSCVSVFSSSRESSDSGACCWTPIATSVCKYPDFFHCVHRASAPAQSEADTVSTPQKQRTPPTRAPPETHPTPVLSHPRVVPNHHPPTPCQPQRATPAIPTHPRLPLEARRRPRELMTHPPLRRAAEAVHGAVWPRRRPATRERQSGGEATSGVSCSSGCGRLPTIVQISRRETMSRA